MRFGVVVISAVVLVLFASNSVFAATCTDTDGGINIALRGTVTAGGKSSTDTCVNGVKIREYYCTAKNTSTFTTPYCPSGQSCVNGACKAASSPTPTPSPSASPSPSPSISPSPSPSISPSPNATTSPSPTPSTSPAPSPTGGCFATGSSLGYPAYFGVKGTCTDAAGVYEDYNNDSMMAYEWRCGPTSSPVDQQTCYQTGSNCQALGWDYAVGGQCIKLTTPRVDCVDSDGGPIYDKKGTCTDSVATYTDQYVGFNSHPMINSPVIREFSCTPITSPFNMQGCSAMDFACKNWFSPSDAGDGICAGTAIVPTPTPTPTPGTAKPCSDTDTYLGYPAWLGVKGTCTDNYATFTDVTVDSNSIKEYGCGPTSNPAWLQTCIWVQAYCTGNGFSGGAGPDGTCLKTSVTGGVTKRSASNAIEQFLEWIGSLFK